VLLNIEVDLHKDFHIVAPPPAGRFRCLSRATCNEDIMSHRFFFLIFKGGFGLKN
jgi:hypothetical protein